MAEIDETIIIDNGLPKKWKCPHCGRTNVFDEYAEDIFMNYFKVIRQCGHCGYLHIWTLQLTEEFKRKVVKMLTKA